MYSIYTQVTSDIYRIGEPFLFEKSHIEHLPFVIKSSSSKESWAIQAWTELAAALERHDVPKLCRGVEDCDQLLQGLAAAEHDAAASVA